MYIKRKIEAEIKEYLHTEEILALIGPRQSGKTTVLKKVFNELTKSNKLKNGANFISFEDREALSLFNSDIRNFAETYIQGNDYLFIDEFQYAREGGKNLKYLFDSFDTKIVISGSSAIDLTIEALKFLVGRVFILEMHPFDFEEFLLFKDKNYHRLYLKNKIDFLSTKFSINNSFAPEQVNIFRNYFEEYAIWGGYPRVILAKNRSEKEVVLKNIYNTYFLREVKTLMDIANDYQLEKMIKILGLQISNLVEYENLGNEIDISFETLKKYINFLEKTYICKLIRPFYKNKRKEVVKMPKIFFSDTGLRNMVVNDFRLLDERVDAGELLENAVWMQLNRQGIDMQYWRDKNKNEIDLILSLKEQRTLAIEVKKNIKRCKEAPVAFSKSHPDVETFCAYLDSNKGVKFKKSILIPTL